MSEGASRYRITRLIQRGGMAEVFEANIIGEGGFSRQVAIKRLLPAFAGDEGFVKAFVGEAKLVSQLQHANLVSVFDFGTMDGLPFQVLELVNGSDLERLDAHAREYGKELPPEAWLAIVSEAAHGLDYAHNARDAQGRPLGIVHRDVSPTNIMVAWQGGVKIGDFGIAHSFEDREATRVGVVKGKLAYMSPEQTLGDGVDPRTDVFSLGCVLHRMIARVSPLETDEQRARFVSGAKVTIDPSVPPDIAKILHRALEPDRNRRYPTAAHVAADCARAATARGGHDARAIIRDCMERLRPTEERPREPNLGLGQLMNVDVVLHGTGDEAVRRFASQVRKSPEIETRQQRVVRPQGTSSRTPPSNAMPGGVTATGSAASNDPLIGTIIGEYQILEMIGKGGFARVYRARHLVFQGEFALKVLLDNFKDSPGAQRRFQREALALHAVSHPNLVAIEDSGVTPDGRPYIVMEMVNGPTLREALVASNGPFGLHRTRRLARQIGLALNEAHKQGFVHRDLKPKNIVLMPTPLGEEAKVLDFGLALLLDPRSELTRLTSAGHYLGTARWMAPEQVVNAASVGPPADLYCLGLILFAMAVGQPPFKGTPDEVMRKHREEIPEIPAVAGPYADLIGALLQKDPQRRPESASAVVQALDRLNLGDEPEERQEPTRVETQATELGALQSRLDGPQVLTRPLVARPGAESTSTASRSQRAPPAGGIVVKPVALAVAALALLLAAIGGFLLATWLNNPATEPVARVTAPPVPEPEVVPDQPVAVAAAQPSEEPAPTPTMPTTAVEPRREDPARVARQELDAARSTWEKKIQAELGKKGLVTADLDLDAEAKAARAAFASTRDVRQIERNGAAVIVAIQGFNIEPAALTTRVDALRKSLEKVAQAQPDAVWKPLEEKYLDVRAKLRANKNPLELARQIREIERELRSLGG